jgi:predicted SAM-dependent methyltransferase
VKIDFGCGKHTRDGFYCIDAQRNPKAPRAPDLIYSARFRDGGELIEQIPLGDACADELHSYHVVEHVYAWESPALVREFRRLLKPGALLVLELPNIEWAAKNLLSGMSEQMAMWPLYGDPGHRDPYMCHRWGYTPKTIKALLSQCGFTDINILPPKTHGAKANRDMRVEARA